MAGTMPFTIGADVSCTDGVGGKLIRASQTRLDGLNVSS
jgi:hypothetical protein